MSSTEDFQMIMDFAEGNLDPAKEDSLFLKLSADEELRLEFKSHMALKNAMRIGAASVILPAASKAAVFSNLGLRLEGSGGAFAGFMHSLFNRKTIATAGIILLLSSLTYVLY